MAGEEIPVHFSTDTLNMHTWMMPAPHIVEGRLIGMGCHVPTDRQGRAVNIDVHPTGVALQFVSPSTRFERIISAIFGQ